MRVFVIGASGYVGSAVATALRRHGHEVIGSARSNDASRSLRHAGIEPEVADVTQPHSLSAAAQRADGVVYSVQYHGEDPARVEGDALHALVDALAGSNKPLLFTSGAWIYGSSGERAVDEDAAFNPTPVIAHRPQLERIVLDGVASNVRAVVIRPGDVYGGGGGLPAMWVQSAKEEGAARFVGAGTNHWPVVHLDDLGELYALATAEAAPGAIFNAADETWFTVREMAEAASYGAGRNGAVTPWPLDQARQALGAFADALVLDSRLSSKRAHEQLGWLPSSVTILEDLRDGSYAKR